MEVEYCSIDTEQHNVETGIEGSVSDTRGGSDYTMGRAVRLENYGEILGTN